MTQRIFDMDNCKDVRDLFDILPDSIVKIKKLDYNNMITAVYSLNCKEDTSLFSIIWHNKSEVTRPKAEATNKDVGKLCAFWDEEEEEYNFCCSVLFKIDEKEAPYIYIPKSADVGFMHCRRLTKEEIENLC